MTAAALFTVRIPCEKDPKVITEDKQDNTATPKIFVKFIDKGLLLIRVCY